MKLSKKTSEDNYAIIHRLNFGDDNTYHGMWVAIVNGKLIDADHKGSRLFRNMERRGYTNISLAYINGGFQNIGGTTKAS
jgi:hypothetical protein